MRGMVASVALAGLAGCMCTQCSDPPDVHEHELVGSDDAAGAPIGIDPGATADAPGELMITVRNRAPSPVALDGTLHRVVDLDGNPHAVQAIGMGEPGCTEAPASVLEMGVDASCRLILAALPGDAFLPDGPADGRTFTVRLAVRVGGGEVVYVDEQVVVGAHRLREGVCGP